MEYKHNLSDRYNDLTFFMCAKCICREHNGALSTFLCIHKARIVSRMHQETLMHFIVLNFQWKLSISLI